MSLSALEQYLLELINRARLDPPGEATRYGIALNEGLAPGTIAPDQKQPLANNGFLNIAAEGHSAWMLAADIFSHTGSGGSSAGDRMQYAGYVFQGAWTWGENISWTGTTGSLRLFSAIEAQHRSLFLSEGHRTNTLNDRFKEIGLAQVEGQFTYTNGVTYNASMLTEKFASSVNAVFVSGVAYADLDADRFYTPGEGIGGLSVASGGATTATSLAGGYALALAPQSTASVSLELASSTGTLSVSLTDGNVKVDIVNGDTILVSSSATILSGITRLKLIGSAANDLSGDHAENELSGNHADNELLGFGGADTLYGGDGNDSLDGGTGADFLVGNTGNDTITGGFGFDRLFGGFGNDDLYGGGDNDTILGFEGADRLFGEVGDDLLNGEGGNDALFGGFGNDAMFGGSGADFLAGFFGDDTLLGQEGNDVLNGGAGNDQMLGGKGDDQAFGCDGNDDIRGWTGNDRLFGQIGNDTILGEAGDDIVDGGGGNDVLDGGAGFDTIYGWTGDDVLTGGADSDVFIFSKGFGTDTITDFDALDAHEVIDLSLMATGVVDFAGLVAAYAVGSVSAGVLIDFGSGNSIVLHAVNMGDLDNSDFVFF